MGDTITTKNITSVDEVQSVDNTDKVFVNDNGSFKQISVSNLMKQAPSGVTEETDPTVSEWAKQPTKPSYTADEVGALPVGTKIPAKTSDLANDSGYLTQIPEEYVTETELGQKGYVIEDDIPEKLPSPGILTFTGAVNDTYDGSANKTINIPTGGGEGGTSDYNALANKPKLNGVEIAGNKTSTDYKIVSSEQGIENNGKFLGVGVDGNVTLVDKPTYTADEVGARPDTWTPSAEDVGALPNNTEIPSKTSDLENDSGFITNSDIPEKLPNPQKIIFTGAVSAEYDGSSQQTINIPTGGGSDPYTLPIMSSTQLGGGKAVSKTDEDVPVAVDPLTGQLFVPTYPENTGGGGETVDPEQIKQAVNEYLEENPVSGMTAEQEQQLNQNTTDVADLKRNIRLLVANLVSCLKNVAWVKQNGQDYVNDLINSFYGSSEGNTNKKWTYISSYNKKLSEYDYLSANIPGVATEEIKDAFLHLFIPKGTDGNNPIRYDLKDEVTNDAKLTARVRFNSIPITTAGSGFRLQLSNGISGTQIFQYNNNDTLNFVVYEGSTHIIKNEIKLKKWYEISVELSAGYQVVSIDGAEILRSNVLSTNYCNKNSIILQNSISGIDQVDSDVDIEWISYESAEA